MTPERAPAGLSARGRRLWRAVAVDFDLSLSERELLTEACRCLDNCERLELALRDEPLTVAGQPRADRRPPSRCRAPIGALAHGEAARSTRTARR